MLIESPANIETGYQSMMGHILHSNVACGVLIIDTEGRVEIITPEAGRTLGLPSGQAGSVGDLPEPLQSVIREVQTTGKTVHAHIPPGGSSQLGASVSAAPSASARGDTRIVVLVKSDTSILKLEQHIRRLDRLASVGTLSASMAHEIKNALVAVRTFTELLLEKNPDLDFAAVVRRELARVDSIASHMLKFGGPAQPKFSDVKLHELLEHSLRVIQHGNAKKLVVFARDFKAVPDVITGDDHQLEQAFVNIFFNAIEAMNGEGTLSVSTDVIHEDDQRSFHGDHKPPMVRVKISDTGAGVPLDKLNHIFEPFFTTKQNGTGLGLAVTQRIIQEHHGAIHVESIPGKGATFIILLPAHFKERPC